MAQKFNSSKTYAIGIPHRSSRRDRYDLKRVQSYPGSVLIKTYNARSITDLINNTLAKPLDENQTYWVYEISNDADGKPIAQYFGEFMPNAATHSRQQFYHAVGGGLADGMEEQTYLAPQAQDKILSRMVDSLQMQLNAAQNYVAQTNETHRQAIADLNDQHAVHIDKLVESHNRSTEQLIKDIERSRKYMSEQQSTLEKLQNDLYNERSAHNKTKEFHAAQKFVEDRAAKVQADLDKQVAKFKSEQSSGMGDVMSLLQAAMPLIQAFRGQPADMPSAVATRAAAPPLPQSPNFAPQGSTVADMFVKQTASEPPPRPAPPPVPLRMVENIPSNRHQHIIETGETPPETEVTAS